MGGGGGGGNDTKFRHLPSTYPRQRFSSGAVDCCRAILNQQQSIKKKQDAQRLQIQGFVERFRAKASKAKQAQSRIKILEKMKPINALVENAVTKFSFPTPAELRPPLVVINKGKVGYNGKIVLNRLSLRIDAEDRIALLGSNGEGKSTLSKLLANKLILMSGEYFATNKLRIGYFAQHQLEELSEKDSAYGHIMNLQTGMTEIHVSFLQMEQGPPS